MKTIENRGDEAVTSSSLSYGQNSWLIEQMYEKFQNNPSDLDQSWRDFFTSHKSEYPHQSSPKHTPTSSIRTNKTVTSATKAKNSAKTLHPHSTSEQVSSSHTQNPDPISESTDNQNCEQQLEIHGEAANRVKAVEKSLSIPSSVSTRAIPAKLLIENQTIINQHLALTRGGEVAFIHLIAYAAIQSLKKYPELNYHFSVIDGNPTLISPEHINLAVSILSGSSIVTPTVHNADEMDVSHFIHTLDEEAAHLMSDPSATLELHDDATILLTNVGSDGSGQSIPRLLDGLGAIISLGAMEYPAEYSGASEETIAQLGIGKLLNINVIYDQRILNGVEVGEFLASIHDLLISDKFYDDIFQSLAIPYTPVRWAIDITHGDIDKNSRVLEIIDTYRSRGHLMAQTDPLCISMAYISPPPDLDQSAFELTLWDLDREFQVGGFQGKTTMKLRDTLQALRDAYTRHIGTEYMHILDHEQRKWLQHRLEAPQEKPSRAEQKYILNRLNAAEAFETFLQTKYVGQKRFSLEGAEAVIPMMDAVLDRACRYNMEEAVIGMPHRGRLNILANVVGKPYSKIFTEFEGNIDPRYSHGSGDVKYHLGAKGKYYQMFGENEIDVSVTANPSHLEAVDPVLEGIVRAKTDSNGKPGSVLPIMLHGDAAFAGQGIVAETLQMADLPGYSAGGTIHIVVNNQIGFTTAPKDSRSSQYCTDVAKMTGVPIFHVNGDDPEACVDVARLAVDFRQNFHKDVVIDLVCYRRRGHNEGDDPSMTQPLMYDVIDTMRSVRKSYTEDLIGRGDITIKEAEDALRDYQEQLKRVFNEVRELEKYQATPSPSVEGDQVLLPEVKTAISQETIELIGDAFVDYPQGFTVHPRVDPVAKRRYEMSREGNIDWAFGELLAFGSLVREGRRVRLAGEDSRRGTFSQRHSVLIDRKNGNEYHPLRNIPPLDTNNNGIIDIYDSLLSEYGAMGFEYGYTLANPDALVMWEAQFGDFAPGAQSIIDEFISSGEAKWGQLSKIVLLLPHGQEGQGPDHSSGRIERYLQLCAESSMTVAQPSTPASYFHLLRRHAIGGITRPLIIFTPKSMLRLKAAVSHLEDFTCGKFRSVLEEPGFLFEGEDRSLVQRVLLVSGKLYYELLDYKVKHHRTDIAILRLEQLYPVPYRRLAATLALYPQAKEIFWVQEEPANQGAWSFLALALPELVADERIRTLRRVSRRAMSAPASGSPKTHTVEQLELIKKAFA